MIRRSLLACSLSLTLGLGALAPAALAHAAPQAPEQVQTVQTPAGPVTQLTLKNGLTVLLKENHAAPVVTWVVAYKVGARNEPVGATGSAHLLEHMMFKGTKTLGKGQVAQLLSRNGASFNATTHEDFTNYFETYSSDRLELGLMVEAARMRDALILDSERKSEMTVVRNEMERGESNPSNVLDQELEAAAFKAHPYHHPVIGWRSDVENVPTSQLKRYYNKYYLPNNAVASLVGDFKTAEAIAMIRRYFDAIPAGPTPPSVYTVDEPQQGERRVTLHRRGETNLIQMGYHVPGIASQDVAPLELLATVLSGGESSRLHQAIVEKEVATSAWASADIRRDAGLFEFGATLKPGTRHQDVEDALDAQIEKIRSAPVSEDELEKAKSQWESGYVYQNEGTQGLAFELTYYGVVDHWQRAFELRDAIRKVTAADLQRVARQYLQTDNRTVGWYVATPDGPVPPQPTNAGSGKAVANGAKVVPPKLFAFEKRTPPLRHLTMPVRKVLPNGMTVIVLENPSSETVAFAGFVRAGSAMVPADQREVPGAVAAMLDKGTAHHSKLALADRLERVSASVFVAGGSASSSLHGDMLAKDFDLGLGTLAEELREPTFPDNEFAKLKHSWIANIKRSEDRPGTKADLAYNHAIYPKGHPYYEKDPETKITEIKAMTPVALRQFYEAHYGPNVTTLVVVGHVKPAVVFQKVAQCFDGWKPVKPEAIRIPVVAAAASGQRTVIPMMDQTNVEILFGTTEPFKRSSPEYYAASLANYVLGGGSLASRLGVKLRDEMGLTYGISSSFSAGEGPGSWDTSVTTNPANVDTVVATMRQEIDRFLKQGVTAQELTFAKSAFIGRQATRLATNGGMAGSLSGIEYDHLGLDFWSRYPQLIEKVSLAEVNAAARKLIRPEAANLVIVGPYRDKQ